MAAALTTMILVGNALFSRAYTEALQSRALAIATAVHVQLDRVLQLGLTPRTLVGFDRQCQDVVTKYEGIRFAAVTDSDGSALFHSTPWPAEFQSSTSELRTMARVRERAVHSFVVNGKHGYVAVDPVFSVTGEYVGSVLVGISDDAITAPVRRMALTQSATALGVSISVIVALILSLSILVTRPLARLLESIDRLRRHRADLASRLDVSGSGEIGRVAKAFNALMQDLEDTSVSKTELERAMEITHAAEERYRLLVESSPSAILVERGNQLVFANPAAVRLLGAEDDRGLTEKCLLDFVHPDSRQAVEEELARLNQGVRTVRLDDVRFLRTDGQDLAVQLVGIAFDYGDDPAVQVVVNDVTEERHKSTQLEHMARHDALTGLPNRIMLIERLHSAIAYAERYDTRVTVVFIDLDNFKIINDSLGHECGDTLLKICAGRLSTVVRELDLVARLGGDEFVVVLFDSPETDDSVIDLIERLQSVIKAPFILEGREYTVTSSVGFATYPEDGAKAEEILRNADEAMYRAKEMGRDNFQPFSTELHDRITERLALENDLRRGLLAGELLVYYQPQVDARDGRVIGAEALVRWNHPTRGIVPPTAFIPVAEETGLIVQIGEFVLNTACKQAGAWQEKGLAPFTMAVNISPRQFWEPNLLAIVDKALKSSGLDSARLELELTEGLLMRDADRSVETMTALREMGVSLAIDDFGTGYSSLQALQRFPIARLKIAQEFLMHIPQDMDSATIARSVIALGHNMKLRVIAEGVERPEQLRFLQQAGCDEIQGYLVSEPIPQQEMETFLRRKYISSLTPLSAALETGGPENP